MQGTPMQEPQPSSPKGTETARTELRSAVKYAGQETASLINEGGLLTSFVRMPGSEASDLARMLYPSFHGRATRLATEKDDTFRLDTADGPQFILKVSNPAETETELMFQIGLMQHVVRVDPSLPVPRVIPDVHRRVLAQIADQAGQQRYVRLMSYLKGAPLDSTGSSPWERELVGRILGRLRLATANFSCPGDSRLLAWDVRHLLSLRPLLGEVGNAYHRQQLARGMERFESLYHRIRPLRTQVLHNDFSKSNIIVDHSDPSFVTGIIDFGDAVRTAVAVDVATALLNQLPSDAASRADDDIFREGRDIVRGYLSVAELTSEDIFLIPHLVMARVIARAIITLRRARSFPENSAYILRNTQQGWDQLDWFLRHSVEEVSSSLIGNYT
jgi:hydroxylysine kinase